MSSGVEKQKIDSTTEEEFASVESKRTKVDDGEDEEVREFVEWCRQANIILNDSKVKITKSSTSHHFGMIAIDDIRADEILTRIPKSSILEPNTTQIHELIAKSFPLLIRFTLYQ